MKNNNLFSIDSTYTLRGVSMIAIVLHHIWLLDHFVGGVILSPAGYLGTGVFFMLSGYGIFFSMQKHGITKDYVLVKVKKMMLPFLLTWFVLLLTYPIFDYHFVDMTEMKNLILFALPYSESWFFRVIICVYFICFIIWSVKIDVRIKIMLIGLACVIYTVSCIFFGINSYWYNTILNFPLGMLFAYKMSSIERIKRTNVTIISLCSLFLFIFFFVINYRIPCSICFSIFSICLASFIKFKNNLLFFVGTNSLMFYFMESPGIRHFSIHIVPCIYILTSLASTFILCYLFVKIERKLNGYFVLSK